MWVIIWSVILISSATDYRMLKPVVNVLIWSQFLHIYHFYQLFCYMHTFFCFCIFMWEIFFLQWMSGRWGQNDGVSCKMQETWQVWQIRLRLCWWLGSKKPYLDLKGSASNTRAAYCVWYFSLVLFYCVPFYTFSTMLAAVHIGFCSCRLRSCSYCSVKCIDFLCS